MALLNVNNWTLSIDGKALCGPLHFSLESGEVLGIVGESGSGKTLFSRALVGQWPNQAEISGEILYKKENMGSFTQRRWQELRGLELSYMAQNPMAVFNPYQTLYSHAYEFLHSHGVTAASDVKGRMLDAMAQCNLEDGENILRRYSFELSGGMLQRCMLSMLLCLPSEVFICDEPTSALDVINRQYIMETLENLKREGRTMVIITHDYHLLTALADKVLVLRKGEQMEFGTADEVIFHPKTAYAKELFQAPIYRRYDDDTN